MINLNLKKPIVFFDIESTGLNIIRDRIIQIALIKYKPGKETPQELSMMINPGMVPISEESTAIHGLTAADVRNKPTFSQVARKIFDFIGEADLGGYNSDRFDIPMLMEEMARCGLDLAIEKRKSVDVQKIFYKMEPRTLRAALRFYCNEDLVDAHDALADVRATVDVLNGQIERYKHVDYDYGDEIIEKPIQADVNSLNSFISDKSVVDVTQRFKRNPKGEVVFNFGKYVGQEAGKVLYEDKNYYKWILDKDFSIQVKKLVSQLRDAYEKAQRN